MDVSVINSPLRRIRAVEKLLFQREDATPYKDIIEMIHEKQRDVEVIFYDNLEEITGDWSEFTFFCGDFQTELYHKLTRNQEMSTNAHLIVGPGVLRHRLQTNKELMPLRPLRPLYCELMRNVTMRLSSEVTNKRELVELVHFMGGSVRKDTNPRTNVLVLARASGRYQSMQCLSVPLLRSDWIVECWKFRDNPYFDVLDPKLIKRHKIGVFEGLFLHFHGFKDAEVEDMKQNLERHGETTDLQKPTFCEKMEDATHVIYNSANEEAIDSLPSNSNQFLVTQEWYWVSLHRGCCAVEESFALPSRTLRKRLAQEGSREYISPVGKSNGSKSHKSKSSSSMQDFSAEGPSLNATPDYIYSNDDIEQLCKSPRAASKRLQVCTEMVETENNYVNLLKLIIKFKCQLEKELEDCEFMKKSDVTMIFGKFDSIHEVHSKILQKLAAQLNEATSVLSTSHGRNNIDFSHVWVEMKDDMMRVYPPYLNSYDTAKNLLDNLDKENAKFHTFCKAKESNPEFRRLKLNDLMVKPVQRLPSVILLLKEVAKKTEARFKASSEEAVKAVDEVLKVANRTRERNDTLISHMSKFTDIENVPAHLVAANRMFIREIVVKPIASTTAKLQKFNQIKLFLFHDVMLITKVRSQKNTIHRLARHTSFANLSTRNSKPYKYVSQIPLSSLRSSFKVRAPDECLKGLEPVYGSREPLLWCMIHRDDEGGDTETVYEAPSDEEMTEFMDDIHIKILGNYGRCFFLHETEPVSRLSDSVAEWTNRHFKRQVVGVGGNMNVTVSERTPRSEWNHNMNETMMAPPQSQGRMRRAISSAQLTLANTLFGRNHSRNHLGQINENSSMIHSPRVSCDPAALANLTSVPEDSTPKRGLRARLTSATFLNRTLNRNTSMRRQTTGLSISEKDPSRSRTSSHRVTDV